MAITQVVAGPYTATYNAIAQNYTRRGFNIHFTSHAERVDESDVYARSLLDMIYQGGGIEVDYVARVYVATASSGFWPYGTGVMGSISNYTNPVGMLASTLAQPFVLTSTANTSAATSPTTATMAKAILAPEQDHTLLYSSSARDMPIRLVSLLQESGSGSTVATSMLTLT